MIIIIIAKRFTIFLPAQGIFCACVLLVIGFGTSTSVVCYIGLDSHAVLVEFHAGKDCIKHHSDPIPLHIRSKHFNPVIYITRDKSSITKFIS